MSSCPRNLTELTLLKSVLNENGVKGEDYKVIMKGITKIFKDEKDKVDGGSDSAEEKARRMARKCSTAGMVVIVLITISILSGTVYTAHCYAPIQFDRLITATNAEIKNKIEVILDTGFLSISLNDAEFIKECIEWLKKASLFYLANKVVSGTDRVALLATKVCTALGLSYRPETSSERRHKSRVARRTARRESRIARQAKNSARGTLRRRKHRRSKSQTSSSDSGSSSDFGSSSESGSSSGKKASARRKSSSSSGKKASARRAPSSRAPLPIFTTRGSDTSSDSRIASSGSNDFNPFAKNSA
jgi:hypothetical protein